MSQISVGIFKVHMAECIIKREYEMSSKKSLRFSRHSYRFSFNEKVIRRKKYGDKIASID